ncbi:MAG: phosphatase PAP2 family protein [Candidatus Aenigmarchaeota archaeon]|nr:phosphatase PAP2 family protein [Candidatus Aenigmarchaeota archaeon]
MKILIYSISDLIDKKPFHLFVVVLILLNLSGIGDPNYLTILSLVGSVAASLLSLALKLLFRKGRPQHNKYRIIKYGFPSGHSHVIFTTAAIYAHYVPSLAAPFFLAASFVSASRVLIRAHTENDVVAGSVLGVFTGLLMVALANKFLW